MCHQIASTSSIINNNNNNLLLIAVCLKVLAAMNIRTSNTSIILLIQMSFVITTEHFSLVIGHSDQHMSIGCWSWQSLLSNIVKDGHFSHKLQWNQFPYCADFLFHCLQNLIWIIQQTLQIPWNLSLSMHVILHLVRYFST